MKNALTVDVEDWYHAHDLNIDRACWDSLEDRIEYSTKKMLELLSSYHIQGTFFVLGCVAQKHPRLVKAIAGAGHEIGSHGYWHQMINHQTRKDFRNDLLSAKHCLEDITGKKIVLYRAPSWSISPDTLWALQILEEEGFICDSSIQPFKTPLSGISNAPAIPFHPVVAGNMLKLVEFPPTVFQLGKVRFPFAGGFYLRALPLGFIIRTLTQVNKNHPGMIYVHPWEIDIKQPRLKVPRIIKITHYFNLGTTKSKLETLLKHFRFVPLGQLITNENYPTFPVE